MIIHGNCLEVIKGLEEKSELALGDAIPSRLVYDSVLIMDTSVRFSPPDGEYIASILSKYLPNHPVLKAKEWNKETAEAILKCMSENSITARAMSEALQVPQGRIWRWKDRI